MALERTYNIPLRREWLKVPKYKRAKKAVAAIRKFLKRHMKAKSEKDVKVGKYLNLQVWEHGIRNPPHHVKVNVVKDDKGVVTAELVGAPVEKKIEGKKSGLLEKVKGTVTGKPAEQPAAEAKPSEAKKPVKTAVAKPAEQIPAAPAASAKLEVKQSEQVIGAELKKMTPAKQ